MKTVILPAFLILAAAIVVYLISSLRTVTRESIRMEDLPRETFGITKWTSDADGIAYIMKNPAARTSVTVGEGLGKYTEEGFRPCHEYLDAVPGKTRVQRIVDKKTSETLGYILASERLEIQAGFNMVKKGVVLYIKDPEDTHHRRRQEGVR